MDSLPKNISIHINLIAGVVVLKFMAGCASGSYVVDHSFEFDARYDIPYVEVLDYRYGNSNSPGVRGCPKQYLQCPAVPQSAGVSGKMLLGDVLYVKWRKNLGGEVFEETVNLRARLPQDMNKKRIRFAIGGSKLYVFVIDLDSRIEPNPCPSQGERHRLDHSSIPLERVLSMYCSKSVAQIYPDEPASYKSK